MTVPYKLVFDDVMLKQLQKAAKNNQLKQILTRMLDKLEEKGPGAGKLLDSKLFIYEIKSKHPPIRLYFKHDGGNDELHVFEFEIKTSEKDQQKTIEKIRKKASKS